MIPEPMTASGTETGTDSARNLRNGNSNGSGTGNAVCDGRPMAAHRDPVELRLAPDLEPPALTPGAAAVLLRILRKAHDRELAADSGRTVTDDQAVA